MDKSRFLNVKRVTACVALVVGCSMVAPAFARSHVSVNIGFGLPGVGVGYSNHGGHHGHRGHHRGGYGGGYGYRGPVMYSAPIYYRAPPRVVYYNQPIIVERPIHVRRGYDSRVVYQDRDYRDRDYRDRRYGDDYRDSDD